VFLSLTLLVKGLVGMTGEESGANGQKGEAGADVEMEEDDDNATEEDEKEGMRTE
jgi:hypothetical protein